MGTQINKNFYTLEGVLEQYTYSKAIESIINLEQIYSDLEIDKNLILFEFEQNDVEAMQMVDLIELQQFYINQKLEILRQGVQIMTKNSFIGFANNTILIGLN
jgi:hypothetical protein